MTPALSSRLVKSAFLVHPRLGTMLTCMFLLAVAPITLHAQTYTDLYDVTCTNGCLSYPPGILAQGRDGNLYGTMFTGGTGGGGTVFKITPSGAVTVIYNFAGPDGYDPSSGLTLGTDGNFYGTTRSGGANSLGTIFQITPTGSLHTLHSFNGSDGQTPYAPPVEGKNGSYYGVALGATGTGTGYSITSSGTFKVLSTAIPQGSISPLLLASDGNFYGTSEQAGSIGQGTVFRMSATGAVKVVYNFDGTHGRVPYGPVVQGSDGFLYGTTPAGGSSTTGGVVFRLTTGGKITVLHEFNQSSTTDGYGPEDGLVAASDGNFYGATSAGVPSAPAQYGTLFKITKSGTYPFSMCSTERTAPPNSQIPCSTRMARSTVYRREAVPVAMECSTAWRRASRRSSRWSAIPPAPPVRQWKFSATDSTALAT